MNICSDIDAINDIKVENAVANDVVIFINTMKEYLIQDELKLNLNYMVEYSYEISPEQEISDAAVTMLTKCTRSEYRQISAQLKKNLICLSHPFLVTTK